MSHKLEDILPVARSAPASQPERPTCETCPYYDAGLQIETYRWPTLPVTSSACPSGATVIESGACRRREGMPLHKTPDDWCGEHTDFPEYVESLKPRPAPGTLDPGKLSVRARTTIARLGGIDAKITLDDLDSAVGCGPATRSEIVNFFKANGVEIV
jgi:hypothetical protein